MYYGYVYKTTNTVNGLVYIGKHSTEKVRETQSLDESYYGSGIKLRKAISKYGIDSFVVEILEWCNDLEELNNRERYWIKELDSQNPNIGYNLAYGGDGGDLGPEAKEKLRLAHLGRPSWNSGKIGCYSNEYREKLSKAHKGRPSWNSGKVGIYSDEYKHKLSEAAINNRGRKVQCLETGAIFRSSKDACIEMNLDVSQKKLINRCCCGHRSSAFNLHWKYIE